METNMGSRKKAYLLGVESLSYEVIIFTRGGCEQYHY